MIVSIRGKILKKAPTEIIIDVNGLGYLCFITINTYDSLGKPGEEVALLTHYQVTENSNALFAFHNETEKHLFGMLISVSGIGPKTAITNQSTKRASRTRATPAKTCKPPGTACTAQARF